MANGAEPTCAVDHNVAGQWTDGFQGTVGITNESAPQTSRTLAFELGGDEKITQGWNGDWQQSGTTVTVKNTGWNGSLSRGGTVAAGFIGSRSGATAVPVSFKLNGEVCSSGADTTPSPGETLAPGFSESSSPTPAASTPTATTSTTAASAPEWNPPSGVVKQLGDTWDHMALTYPDIYGFKNYGFDQVIANKGSIS